MILLTVSRKTISIRDEFRVSDKDPRRHPCYVFAQIDNDMIFFVITHMYKNNCVKLINKLNPDDPRDSYFVTTPQRQHKSTLRKTKINYILSQEDIEQIKPYMEIPAKRTK